MNHTKLFFTIAFLLGTLLSNGQFIYNGSHCAQSGDFYEKKFEILEEGNYLPTEDLYQNMWNFSTLIASESDMFEVLSNDAFEEFPEIPENSVLIPNVDGTYRIVTNENEAFLLIGLLVKIDGTFSTLIFNEPVTLFYYPISTGGGIDNSIKFEKYGIPSDFGINQPMLDSMMFDVHFDCETEVGEVGMLETEFTNYESIKVLQSEIIKINVWVKPISSTWFLYEENMVVDSTKDILYYTPEYGIPVCKVSMNWQSEIKSFEYICEHENGTNHILETIASCYPNPVKSGGQLFFTSPVDYIYIYDIVGRQVFSSNNLRQQSICLPDLEVGQYFVSNGNNEIFKLIIE